MRSTLFDYLFDGSQSHIDDINKAILALIVALIHQIPSPPAALAQVV